MNRQQDRQSALQRSERGWLDLVGRDGERSLREAFLTFRGLVSDHMEWADSRKHRFRKRASWVKVGTLVATSASTVILGISAISFRAYLALPLVALVTVGSGLESFFNWRSRWVLMEETQYRLNRLRDEMDYYLVMTPEADLDRARLRAFFDDEQALWSDVSRRWTEFRKREGSDESSQPTVRHPLG